MPPSAHGGQVPGASTSGASLLPGRRCRANSAIPNRAAWSGDLDPPGGIVPSVELSGLPRFAFSEPAGLGGGLHSFTFIMKAIEGAEGMAKTLTMRLDEETYDIFV